MRDIVTRYGLTLRSALALPAANHAASTNGPDINLAGYNGCMFYILAGAYTDGTHNFIIQEADDNGSGAPGPYSNVAVTDLVFWKANSATDFTPVKVLPAQGATQPVAIFDGVSNLACNWRIGYIGQKKWVRMQVNTAAATTGAIYDVLCEMGEARLMPAPV